MSHLWNLFWLFIVFVSLMPLIQQKLLQAKRLGLIRTLEQKRNSRVITLIHRQETMKFLGFPLMRYIDINDSEEILRAVRLTPEDMQCSGFTYYLKKKPEPHQHDRRDKSSSYEKSKKYKCTDGRQS